MKTPRSETIFFKGNRKKSADSAFSNGNDDTDDEEKNEKQTPTSAIN